MNSSKIGLRAVVEGERSFVSQGEDGADNDQYSGERESAREIVGFHAHQRRRTVRQEQGISLVARRVGRLSGGPPIKCEYESVGREDLAHPTFTRIFVA